MKGTLIIDGHKYISLDEAAHLLSSHPNTVRKIIKQGKIKAGVLMRKLHVNHESVLDYIRQCLNVEPIEE